MKKIIVSILIIIVVIFFIKLEYNRDIIESENIREIVKKDAVRINEYILSLEMEIDKLSDEYVMIFKNNTGNLDEGRHIIDDGMLVSKDIKEKSTAHITGVKDVNEDLITKYYLSEKILSSFVDLYDNYSQIQSVSVVDEKGLARYYPDIDTKSFFVPKTDYSEYNFYKLGIQANVENKDLVWINNPYFNPLNKKWVISVVKASYLENEILGVLNINVSLEVLEEQCISNDEFLVSRNGNIIFINKELEKNLEIPSRVEYVYFDWSMGDLYQSSNFNMKNNKNLKIRNLFEIIKTDEDGYFEYRLDEDYAIYVEKIEGIDSYLVKIVSIKDGDYNKKI